MASTISSANASAMLNVSSVFAVPIPLAGWATDDAFDSENVSPVEAKIGVDGLASFGYTPYLVKVKMVFQPNSPSIYFMDLWRQTMDAAQEAYTGSLTIVAPSVGKLWTFSNGSLTGALPLPPGKKVLMAQTYEMTFNGFSVVAIPMTAVGA
jgi:hypothetical protein